MTVAGLIAELQKLNPDAEVILSAGDGASADTVADIRDRGHTVFLSDQAYG